MNCTQLLRNAKPVPVKDGKIFWHLDESVLPENWNKHQVIIAFNKAFSIIQSEFGRIVFEPSDKESPIVIRFRKNGDKDLRQKFGKGQVAYAYANVDSLGDNACDIYINLENNFFDSHKEGGFSLPKMLVHEVLHALGLDHSPNPQSIMYPTYIQNDSIVITDEDRAAIQAFYNIGYDFTILKEWFKQCDFLHVLTDRQIITLGKLIGINLDPNQKKVYNIKLIKNKIGV
jgi:hypothetical protein